jgi:uncharacterized coiled-coil protein SlyX
MMTNPEAYEKRLAELEQHTRLQAAAIDSLGADLKRLEDLVTWVVDILEVLQTQNCPPQAGGRLS